MHFAFEPVPAPSDRPTGAPRVFPSAVERTPKGRCHLEKRRHVTEPQIQAHFALRESGIFGYGRLDCIVKVCKGPRLAARFVRLLLGRSSRPASFQVDPKVFQYKFSAVHGAVKRLNAPRDVHDRKSKGGSFAPQRAFLQSHRPPSRIALPSISPSTAASSPTPG